MLVHVGDSYVESYIRTHYEAFLEGIKWKVGSRYDLENHVAQQLTHYREVVSRVIKRKVKVQEAFERDRSIKRQKGETGEGNLRKGWNAKYIVKQIISEECHEIVEKSFEAVREESKLP